MNNRLSSFVNERITDFTDLDNIDDMQDALRSVQEQLGQQYPLRIGAEKISSAQSIVSVNPARHSEVVGEAAGATAQQAVQAIEAAGGAYASWRLTPVEERVALLQAVATKLRERKFELSAWLVFEVSKNWNEAHAEVAEAIDFCEYYALQMQCLSTPGELPQLPGEQSELIYVPLGVGVVLAPWNFPLAILCGMTLAPVVAGNTVVMKPSPRSPIVAAKLFEIFEETGFPPGVINLVTGRDEEIGNALVDHPLVQFVNFTGSKEVGLSIHERIGKVLPGQKGFKRAVLEMGGKGTIVVDETADLETAADSIAISAFGYQGQKCSACSRVVAVAEIHDQLLQKLVDRAGRLLVRDPSSPNIALGAVIDERAYSKICSYFSIGKTEGHLATGSVAKKDTGYFVWPTIFAGVAPTARLAQEEIFGPVLALLKARDFNDALDIANNTEYGLTGGVFSSNEKRLQKARDAFEVGNLYLNRKITGAMVGAQPFGGFKLSGTDSKAGGPDYLMNFVMGKTIARKTAVPAEQAGAEADERA